MTYQLGIDLGTTYSAAAIARDGRVEMLELGDHGATTPSVLVMRDDNTVLVGEAAARRAISEANRCAREFKRRIGDPTPILLGGSPYSAESLTAKLLRWVVQQATEIEGRPPNRIILTHPANWGPYKLDLFQQAVRAADLSTDIAIDMISEPVAAALHHETLEVIRPGMTVAVFDLGGGTFDAAILRKTESEFELLGEPEGMERLGGIDFDEAIFAFVREALAGAMDELDPDDRTTQLAVDRLRIECTKAKESLSHDSDTTIAVTLPSLHTEVRLTRAEFEQMIRPSLGDAVDAFARAARSADVALDQIDLTLLVGGSSRIPLVGQLLSGEVGLPIAVHSNPKHVVALGAARAAMEAATEAPLAPFNDAPTQPLTGSADPMGLGVPTAAETPAEPARTTDSAPPGNPLAAAHREVHEEPPPDDAEPAFPIATPERRRLSSPVLAAAVLAIIAAVGLLYVVGRNSPASEAAAPSGASDNSELPLAAEPTSTSPPELPSPTPPPSPTPEPAAVAIPAPEPTATAEPTPTAQPTATPAPPPFQCIGLCAHIESVRTEGPELVIEWTAHGFSPSVDNFHAHVFFDIFAPEQAGTNFNQFGETSQGEWQLTEDQPFRTAGSAVALANAPAAARRLCIVAADSGHGVANPENAECFQIPPELLDR